MKHSNLTTIIAIAEQEWRVNVRNKWTLLFAGVFGILVLGISYFGLVTAGNVGFQGFNRTSASLLNLVLYLIPMIALTMGTLSFTGEKGAGELLFSQPVKRSEVLAGKLAGLFFTILVSTLLGFGFSGSIIAARAGYQGVIAYPILIGFTLVLASIFLCLSALISTICRRKAKAFGISLFFWFFFVIFYDLLVIGLSFVFKERTSNLFLFLSLFGNPVDIVRVATLIVLNGKDIFGAAGAALIRFYGEQGSIAALAGALIVWTAGPAVLANRLLKHQDL